MQSAVEYGHLNLCKAFTITAQFLTHATPVLANGDDGYVLVCRFVRTFVTHNICDGLPNKDNHVCALCFLTQAVTDQTWSTSLGFCAE